MICISGKLIKTEIEYGLECGEKFDGITVAKSISCEAPLIRYSDDVGSLEALSRYCEQNGARVRHRLNL